MVAVRGVFFSASGILFSSSRFDMDGVGVRTDSGQVHCTHTRPWFVVFLKRRHPPSDRIERGYRTDHVWMRSSAAPLQNEQRLWSGFEVWKGLVARPRWLHPHDRLCAAACHYRYANARALLCTPSTVGHGGKGSPTLSTVDFRRAELLNSSSSTCEQWNVRGTRTKHPTRFPLSVVLPPPYSTSDPANRQCNTTAVLVPDFNPTSRRGASCTREWNQYIFFFYFWVGVLIRSVAASESRAPAISEWTVSVKPDSLLDPTWGMNQTNLEKKKKGMQVHMRSVSTACVVKWTTCRITRTWS